MRQWISNRKYGIFFDPEHLIIAKDKREINLPAYKRKIIGDRKMYWQLIYQGQLQKSEVDKMTYDEMLEAFAALSVLSERD